MTRTEVSLLPVSTKNRKKKSKERSYCTCCNGKFYRKDLVEVYYKLLQKSAFHCRKCMSANADNLQLNYRQKQPYFIELFSGSKTVSNTANSFGFKTFTIDIVPRYEPDLIADISKLSLKQIPNSAKCFILWASIPCTYYSILNLRNHWEKITYSFRKYYYIPKTREARSAIQLLEKTLWLIRKINPVYFFIENPRGALRHMPQISSIPFHSISYSDYGLDIYKPTDIFTNCPFLKLHGITRSGDKTYSSSVADMKNSYERSIVPAQLIESILSQIISHHKIFQS